MPAVGLVLAQRALLTVRAASWRRTRAALGGAASGGLAWPPAARPLRGPLKKGRARRRRVRGPPQCSGRLMALEAAAWARAGAAFPVGLRYSTMQAARRPLRLPPSSEIVARMPRASRDGGRQAGMQSHQPPPTAGMLGRSARGNCAAGGARAPHPLHRRRRRGRAAQRGVGLGVKQRARLRL
jgi:hypothetical protein